MGPFFVVDEMATYQRTVCDETLSRVYTSTRKEFQGYHALDGISAPTSPINWRCVYHRPGVISPPDFIQFHAIYLMKPSKVDRHLFWCYIRPETAEKCHTYQNVIRCRDHSVGAYLPKVFQGLTPILTSRAATLYTVAPR